MNIPALEPIPPSEVRSIAVVKPDHIGDLIIHTPVFPALRRRYPHARITAVVGVWAAEVLRNNPYVDEVAAFSPEWLDRSRHSFDLAKHRHNQRTLAELASRPCDLVINLRDDCQSHVNLALNGLLCGRWLLSYAKDFSHLAMISHPVLYEEGRMHVLDRSVRLLEAIGVEITDMPALYPSAEDEAWAEQALAGKPFWVALAPGAGWPGKSWAPENFMALAASLHERGIPLLVVGGKGEESIARQMEEQCGALNLCGKTTLLSLASVLRRVALVVSSDSAPAHIGAAMGTRVVNIMQPPARIEFAPLTEKGEVVSFDTCMSSCRLWYFGCDPRLPVEPCACIQSVPVESVKQAVFRALIKAYDAGEIKESAGV